MSDLERDLQRLWNDQPREEHLLTIDAIRSKAEQFERRTRRSNTFTKWLFVLLIAVEAWQVWRHPELLERLGDLLTIAAFVYVMLVFRGATATRTMPAGLGLTSSVDFYRNELARQRDVASHPWRIFAVFIPGVALSLFGDSLDRSPEQIAAIAAFGVALFLGAAWVTRRTGRRLQHEIEELG